MSISIKNIQKKLEPCKKQAWYPIVENGVYAEKHSKFSGVPMLLESEIWPRCENCKKPMQLFVQLDSKELPIEANNPFGEGYLQVFYCTNDIQECDMECEAYFPFSKSTLVRVLGFDNTFLSNSIKSEVKNEIPKKYITGWIVKADYPNEEERFSTGITLTNEESEFAFDNDITALHKDKLLGWPFWVQGIEYPDCPKCGECMDYIFQIDSKDNLDYMFGDSGCAHITQCKIHKDQLTIAWACC